MTFYNRYGEACCYTTNNDEIYSFRGTPLGYIYSNLIYNIEGDHLGFLEKGWIMDRSGCAVFFSDNCGNMGLVEPIKHVKPIAGVRHIFPVKHTRRVPGIKPVFKMRWSDESSNVFFE